MSSATKSKCRPTEVIYQIYPATFNDSNGDGHGDLKGITEKLDYVKGLGVDAVWISPFFLSPEGKRGDGGYAITDYKNVDPRFGTMQDFEELLAAAHKRGLRVYTDLVLCHTADDHEWFKKSRNREPGFENLYVWHEGKRNAEGKLINDAGKAIEVDDEGKPKNGGERPAAPNNWRSAFGGSAWEYDADRKQFYLHHFNTTQPALNLNATSEGNARAKIMDTMKFWLDKGVDGLRLDALPFANYDPQFRDNSVRLGYNAEDTRWSAQNFDRSMCQPETVELVAEIRKMMESYPPDKRKTALGEVVAGKWGGDNSMVEAVKYLDPEKGLHSCYTQSFVNFWYVYPQADRLRDMIRESVKLSPDGGLGDALDNHDFPRFATRLTEGIPSADHPAVIKQILSLWAALPGSKFLYNGDELGLPQATKEEIPDHKIVDPAIEKREYARTPIPWDSTAKNAGFSTADDPILPVPDRHLPLAVNIQHEQTESTLDITRRLIAQRHESSALNRGETRVLGARYDGDPVVAFIRETENEAVLNTFNMSNAYVSVKVSDFKLDAHTLRKLKLTNDSQIDLRPYSNAHYGLAPGVEGNVEVGMGPAQPFLQHGVKPAARKEGAPKTIFAADMLIADSHVSERDVAGSLPKVMKANPDIVLGEKSMIDEAAHKQLLLETVKHVRNGYKLTAGGGTVSTLAMVKGLLGDDVNVDIMGWAGYGRHGRKVKSFLQASGLNLVTGEWPEGVSPETAVSHIITHSDGRNTILTYPGTELAAFQKARGKESFTRFLEDSISNSDIVLLPESTMSKFGLPFTQDVLTSRWRNKKQLVLSLPTHASFGPTDPEFFKYLLLSTDVVMGNDGEFGRIFGQDITRLPPQGASSEEQAKYDEQMRHVVEGVQAAFREDQRINMYSEEERKKVQLPDQVAFITRGERDALLITKDKVINIPAERVVEVNSKLGAGYAAFAGFLAGYVKGIGYEKSARLAMRLGAEKLQQDGIEPYIRGPRAMNIYFDQPLGVHGPANDKSWTGQVSSPPEHGTDERTRSH